MAWKTARDRETRIHWPSLCHWGSWYDLYQYLCELLLGA